MLLFDQFISKELKEFLGSFKVIPCECTVGYKIECSDGRMFVADNCSKLLDVVESAYNEWLKNGKK
ncbi:MAG: hypothetical protein KA886_04425 [Candidatus Cloacimonetes bacterium]|nr:hypothetical protein [Candidatus Cloacimonadota bacterium]